MSNVGVFVLRVGLIVGFVLGVLAGICATHLWWDNTSEQAYERGYKDASWFVVYDIETNPTVVTDNYGRTWYRVDSTDTMSAVDSNEGGWYGWEISEALAQGWYDRAADTSHGIYEKAAIAWAMSVLLRERKFVIYFDSTDTTPVMEMEGVEVRGD